MLGQEQHWWSDGGRGVGRWEWGSKELNTEADLHIPNFHMEPLIFKYWSRVSKQPCLITRGIHNLTPNCKWHSWFSCHKTADWEDVSQLPHSDNSSVSCNMRHGGCSILMDRKMYSKHVWVTVATVTSGIKSNLQQRSFCIFFVAKGKKKIHLVKVYIYILLRNPRKWPTNINLL